MTDGGGWGGWSPERRPDEPDAQDRAPDETTPRPANPEVAPDSAPGSAQEPPRTYGAPSYGAPSYGAPTAQPTEYQQPQGQPTYQQPTAQPTEYQQPRYQQPRYQQPRYQQPQYPPAQNQPPYQPPQDTHPTQAYGTYGYQGTPTQPGPPVAYGQYGSQPPTAPPATKRSRRKMGLIIGIVVVLVAGLAVGGWALFLRGGPAVTWQGKEVTKPEAVLSQAQDDLNTLVTDAKGVKGSDTRCYFSVPKSPAKDADKTDVGHTVYCGPALFVDGDTSKPFIPYGLTASNGSDDKVTLSISAKGTEAGATSVPADQKLVRPDGAAAPGGSGGLKVPEPPPAAADVFTTISDVDVPDAPAGATMAALDGGVTIEKLGEIKRYGKGSDARSAPDGQKLIAFQLGDASGDGKSDGATALNLTVSVDGGAGKKIPSLDGLNVIAVPTAAKTVDLVTLADNVRQSLSLLDGKPGKSNIAVLARSNRFGSFKVPGGFTFTETGGGASAARPCTLTGSVAGLFYWADDKGSARATSTANAILETDLKYTFSTDSPAPFTGSSAGDTATFEPSHLTLTLPTGQKAAAKIVADRTVFEVPASFTTGTITIGGSFTNGNGITFTVAAPVAFKVSIPVS